MDRKQGIAMEQWDIWWTWKHCDGALFWDTKLCNRIHCDVTWSDCDETLGHHDFSEENCGEACHHLIHHCDGNGNTV